MQLQTFFGAVCLSLYLSIPGWAGESKTANFRISRRLSMRLCEVILRFMLRKEEWKPLGSSGDQATYLEDPEVNIEAWGVPLNQPLRYTKRQPPHIWRAPETAFFWQAGLKGEWRVKT